MTSLIEVIAERMRKAPILGACTISDYLDYNVTDAIDLGAIRGDKFHGLDIVREAEIEAVEMALMRVLAHAALRTMRVPTEAMVQSAMAPYLHGNTEQFNAIMRSTIIGYWTAMIDAALTEEAPKK